MALRERYIKERLGDGASVEEAAFGNQDFQEMKSRLHRAIISRLDLRKFNMLSPDRVHAEVSRLAEDLLLAENAPLSEIERDRLVNEVHHELRLLIDHAQSPRAEHSQPAANLPPAATLRRGPDPAKAC